MKYRIKHIRQYQKTLPQYVVVLLLFVLCMATSNISFASNSEKNVLVNEISILDKTITSKLFVNQRIRVNEYNMVITSLNNANGSAAAGYGEVFIPFLNKSIQVKFDEIGVNEKGELVYGEVSAVSNLTIQSFSGFSEEDWMAYKSITKEKDEFPLLVSPELEAQGLGFDGHDLVITDMTLTRELASVDALFLVENKDGTYTSFMHVDVPLAAKGLGLEMCNMRFMMESENFESNDPLFPITIFGYNVDDGTGTYVSFDCEGFKEFNLEGEYVFDKEYFIPDEEYVNPQEKVIASFNLNTRKWGDFTVGIDFNTPFQIKGADDVIFTIENAYIDYSESEVIDNLPQSFENTNIRQAIWRGIYIEEVTVQLPGSFKIKNDERIIFSALNLVYENPNNLSAEILVNLGADDNGIAGNLGGWGISAKTASLIIENSSVTEFQILGDISIPVLADPESSSGAPKFIDYTASFNSSGASLDVNLEGDYKLPFLEGSILSLGEGSNIGIENTSNGYKPFANLNGNINVEVADMELEGLGFQGFEIPTSGIADLSFEAFDFAGYTFAASDNTSTSENTSTTTTESTQGENVKGFPISIKNISFGDGGYAQNQTFVDENGVTQPVALKKLAFTLALNFTNPKVGLSAEGDFEIYGSVNPSKLFPLPISNYKPWEAFYFDHADMTRLEVDADLGGVKLYGLVQSFNEGSNSGGVDFGKGFKGAFELTVEPAITVNAVAQFGKVNGFRYWYADAKMLSKFGMPVVPGVVSLYGFGGGAYYNMKQATAVPSNLNVGDSDHVAAPADLTSPGETLSGVSYVPKGASEGEMMGVKAMVVLGTQPTPDKANMDLTLEAAFNLTPTFGLRMVQLRGDAYFMAPITSRDQAKVTASASITYNHIHKLIDAQLVTDINATPLIGGGTAAMHVNLNSGNSDDWFIAIGYPKLTDRLNLKFSVEGLPEFGFNSYFVMGNVAKIPGNKGELPKLEDYHTSLSKFQNEVDGFDLSATQGNSILMGAQYTTGDISEEWWVFRAKAAATAGFDLLMSKMECNGYDEIGIKGWYLQGNAYAALSGGVDIRVNLAFYKGWFDIFSIDAAAIMQAKLPNPSWMQANVSGRYSILRGLVKGNFEAEFEVGEKCEPLNTGLGAQELLAEYPIISDIKPEAGSTVEVYRKKLVIAALAIPMNKPIYFDELKTSYRPVLVEKSINNNAKGTWSNTLGYYSSLVFQPSELLKPNTQYTIKLRAKWQSKKDGETTWTDIPDAIEEHVRTFTSGPNPDFLPQNVINAQYPEYRALFYHKDDNPRGCGIALSQAGWGYLFNPKKEYNGSLQEYDFFLRILNQQSNQIVFEEPLAAVPTPEWGTTSDGVTQPTKSQSQSNIKNVPNAWTFCTACNSDMQTYGSSRHGRIGFPDFSAAIEPNTVYAAQIVAVPILDESYSIDSSSIEVVEEASDSNWVVVTTTQKTIEQSVSSAKERLIYEYDFATSNYPSFKSKIADLQWEYDTHSSDVNSLNYNLDSRDLNKLYYSNAAISSSTLNGMALISSNMPNSIAHKLIEHQIQKYDLQSTEPFDRYEVLRLSKILQVDTEVGTMTDYAEFASFNNNQAPKLTKKYTFGASNVNIGHSKFFFESEENKSDLNNTNRMSDWRNQDIKLSAVFYPRYLREVQINQLYYSYFFWINRNTYYNSSDWRSVMRYRDYFNSYGNTYYDGSSQSISDAIEKFEDNEVEKPLSIQLKYELNSNRISEIRNVSCPEKEGYSVTLSETFALTQEPLVVKETLTEGQYFLINVGTEKVAQLSCDNGDDFWQEYSFEQDCRQNIKPKFGTFECNARNFDRIVYNDYYWSGQLFGVNHDYSAVNDYDDEDSYFPHNINIGEYLPFYIDKSQQPNVLALNCPYATPYYLHNDRTVKFEFVKIQGKTHPDPNAVFIKVLNLDNNETEGYLYQDPSNDNILLGQLEDFDENYHLGLWRFDKDRPLGFNRNVSISSSSSIIYSRPLFGDKNTVAGITINNSGFYQNQFKITNGSSNEAKIVLDSDPSFSLTAVKNNTTNEWEYKFLNTNDGANTNHFSFELLDNGNYLIKNEASGEYLYKSDAATSVRISFSNINLYLIKSSLEVQSNGTSEFRINELD